MSKKDLLEQVTLALMEVENLQSDLDNLYIKSKIELDPDNELTSMISTLEYLKDDIEQLEEIEEIEEIHDSIETDYEVVYENIKDCLHYGYRKKWILANCDWAKLVDIETFNKIYEKAFDEMASDF